jgi:hypothetical protein
MKVLKSKKLGPSIRAANAIPGQWYIDPYGSYVRRPRNAIDPEGKVILAFFKEDTRTLENFTTMPDEQIIPTEKPEKYREEDNGN